MSDFAKMLARHTQPGRVMWIGVRPSRRAPMQEREYADLDQDGIIGDRARSGPRALSLIQHEHLPVIAALCDVSEVRPDLLRRNIVLSGINLGALRGHPIVIGTAQIELTKICAPCSRMEEAFGPGGYNAVRGHGGWCARILRPGRVARGDLVQPSV